MSDLFLIHHTLDHLKTLDPEYYDRSKNDILNLFSHLDVKSKIDVISQLSDLFVKSLQSFDEGESHEK